MEKIRVLMTGAGAPGGPGIIRCLQADTRIELTVCDADENATGRFLNKDFFRTLPASDTGFSDFMKAKCSELAIDVLFPLVTKELFVLANCKGYFEKNGTKVIVSDKQWLDIANNKSKLHIHLEDANISVPQFRIVKNITELEDAFKALGYPKNKICIKPSVSNGSRGVRIVDADANEFDLLFNEKPNSLYIKKEELFRILNGREFPELLVAEVLPSEEYSVDTLMNEGECRLIVPRLRTRMREGISIAGEIVENVEVIEYVRQISSILPLHGPIGFQVKKAADGQFKILEINPRIQGTSVALTGAGVNLPLLSVLQETDFDFTVPTVIWGTKFNRYYNEVYY